MYRSTCGFWQMQGAATMQNNSLTKMSWSFLYGQPHPVLCGLVITDLFSVPTPTVAFSRMLNKWKHIIVFWIRFVSFGQRHGRVIHSIAWINNLFFFIAKWYSILGTSGCSCHNCHTAASQSRILQREKWCLQCWFGGTLDSGLHQSVCPCLFFEFLRQPLCPSVQVL